MCLDSPGCPPALPLPRFSSSSSSITSCSCSFSSSSFVQTLLSITVSSFLFIRLLATFLVSCFIVRVYVFLSVSLCECASVCLNMWASVWLPVRLSAVCMCLSECLPACLCVCRLTCSFIKLIGVVSSSTRSNYDWQTDKQSKRQTDKDTKRRTHVAFMYPSTIKLWRCRNDCRSRGRKDGRHKMEEGLLRLGIEKERTDVDRHTHRQTSIQAQGHRHMETVEDRLTQIHKKPKETRSR